MKSKASCKCDRHVFCVFRLLIAQQNLSKTDRLTINTLLMISLANIYWSFFVCLMMFHWIEAYNFFTISLDAIHCVSLAFFPFVLNSLVSVVSCCFLNPFCPPFLKWCFISLISLLSIWYLLLLSVSFFSLPANLHKVSLPNTNKIIILLLSPLFICPSVFFCLCLFWSFSVFLLSVCWCLLASLTHSLSGSPQCLSSISPLYLLVSSLCLLVSQ